MWMMGCSDGGDFGIPESFNGRKLRPLLPRTPMAPSNNTSPPPRLRSLHGNDTFSLNHHLASMSDQSKRDFHTQQVVVSSRWNPTPEQLRTLEELYRRGTRTPSTEQIQHITAQLRRYGKIEGKNVFYWFQNHKARERQKRRRQMESSVVICSDTEHQQHHQQQLDIEMSERNKEPGGNKTDYDEEEEEEGEQIKNWALSTNCSTLPEESISTTQRAGGAGGKGSSGNNNNNVAECRDQISSEGWYQLDDHDEMEFVQNSRPSKNFIERNATWHPMMHLYCPSPTHLINTNPATFSSNFSTTSSSSTLITPPKMTTTTKSTIRTTTMDPYNKLIKTNNFIAPNYYTQQNGYSSSFSQEEKDHYGDENGCGCGEAQTLQLFPLRSNSINEGKRDVNDKETETSSGSLNANFPPSRFFEFLPLKN